MSERSWSSVSNSLAARASSSSSGGSTFSLISLTVSSTVPASSSERSKRTSWVSPGDIPTSARSSSGTSRPAPSSTT